MSGHVRIALLGLTPLETMGMREALRSTAAVETESFSDFASFTPLADRFDGYVAAAAVFVANLEFFMPRRQKTIIISAGRVMGEGSLSGDGGELAIMEETSRLVAELGSRDDAAGELSAREKEVIREVASGKTNKEIADGLCISVNTVITHRKNIASKLGIKSASGLSLYAMMNGLL